MLKLLVLRDKGQDGFTTGTLFIDGVFRCFTLEDELREVKIKHETAIPAGTYPVEITQSARFNKALPILLNVPGFEGIRIHAGNTCEDTSGCVLVGLSQGGKNGAWLGDSRAAMNIIQPEIAAALAENKLVEITIRDWEA
jgi:hypothetical protein